MLKPLGVNNHRVHLKKLAKLFANACNDHFGRHFGQEKTFRSERRTRTSALGFLNQGSWGSGDDLACKLNSQSPQKGHAINFKGVTSTLMGTLRSDDATAAKPSLQKWICVLSVFIAIVKCRWTVLELNFSEPYSSFRKRIKYRRRLFTSSLKSKIRQFLFVVVQKRQRNVQNSEMHVQSCCFAYYTFCCFLLSRRCRGGSRGRVQEVRTPSPEMTCGFLIQLVFCKKNYVVYWCWSKARDECTPS